MRHTRDISLPVMKKIAVYETGRISRYSRRFFFVLGVVFLVAIGAIGILYAELSTMQAFDGFALFFEDKSVISEFWQDTVSVFWEQVPPFWFWFGVFCICSIVLAIVMTAKERRKNRKKLEQVRRYV